MYPFIENSQPPEGIADGVATPPGSALAQLSEADSLGAKNMFTQSLLIRGNPKAVGPLAAATLCTAMLTACGFKAEDVALPPLNQGIARQGANNSMNSMNARNSMNSMNSINSMNSMNSMNALNPMSAMQAMNALDAMSALNPMNAISAISGSRAMNELIRSSGTNGLVLDTSFIAAPDSLAETDLSTLSPDAIDQSCPYTSWKVGAIQYTLPKFLAFMNLFEKVKCAFRPS